ncbi:hypothetical protein BJY00DRAFT_288897 [Aspergillus carlsbadensis]|nr:hypothetical protein BJY00DRAFT_288897 [Aspergillus carlsbadensis]
MFDGLSVLILTIVQIAAHVDALTIWVHGRRKGRWLGRALDGVLLVAIAWWGRV